MKGHKWVQRAQVAEGGTSLEVGSKFVIMWEKGLKGLKTVILQ